MKMLKDIYVAFKAEGELSLPLILLSALTFNHHLLVVVIITSNPKGNAEMMQGCKDNGMHSFGPLWDS